VFDNGAGTLTESDKDSGQDVVLSSHVTNFETDLTNPPCVKITLTLTGDNGDSVTFSEYVFPRNRLQKTGKRVR
jgi:hypothetical protein